MYEPFPGNYVWNLSVNLALAMGGAIGEIDQANDEVRTIAREGEDAGTEAFFASWGRMADRLVSLGYYAPRAVAYEKRFALCVAWGANHNWGELQRRRLAREGDMPVPHYWDHVMWVWGQPDMDAFMALMPKVTLEGHLQNITVPFLITHGGNDRQIPIEYAHRSFNEAVNSPDRELKIFGPREGGVEHVSADNMEPVRSYIADWIADRFARMKELS